MAFRRALCIGCLFAISILSVARAARAQSPQREKDLILAAAPIGARIYVDGRNRHGDAIAAPMNAGV